MYLFHLMDYISCHFHHIVNTSHQVPYMHPLSSNPSKMNWTCMSFSFTGCACFSLWYCLILREKFWSQLCSMHAGFQVVLLFRHLPTFSQKTPSTPILNKKRNITCIINARLLLTEVIIWIFYFMSKCKNVFKAQKMNITTKAGKFKSTDQFDSRKGQNLKLQVQNAL